MANRNTQRKLTKAEYEERAAQQAQMRTRTWQRVAFIFVSVIVLASMIVTLFVRF